MDNLYLAHHGVKGMKWGVRRTPEELGHPSKRTERLIAKNERLDEKRARIREKAPMVRNRKPNGGYYPEGYARGIDAYRINRIFEKESRINSRIYKSDARDKGLTPDKSYADNIKAGWTSLRSGLKNNEKRFAKEEKARQKAQERVNEIEENAASKAALVIERYKQKRDAGNLTFKDYREFAKELKAINTELEEETERVLGHSGITETGAVYLAHHGIKGQKWGVRRTPAQLGHDVPSEGEGGGGVDLDEAYSVLEDPEELKKKREELETLAETNFSDKDIRDLATGRKVNQHWSEKHKDGNTYYRDSVYYRDGNELKVSWTHGKIDKNGRKTVMSEQNGVTLENKAGSKPFTGISVKQTKAQRDSMMARTAAERGRQKLHQIDVDRKIAEAKESNQRRFRYSEDVQRQQAERMRKQKELKDKASAKSTKTTQQEERQAQHRRDVDRKLGEARIQQRVKQRDHKQDVDRKIDETKRQRQNKQREHRLEVDRRIKEGRRQLQEKHRREVDERIERERGIKRDQETIDRLREEKETKRRNDMRKLPNQKA